MDDCELALEAIALQDKLKVIAVVREAFSHKDVEVLKDGLANTTALSLHQEFEDVSLTQERLSKVLSTQETLQEQVIKRNVELTKAKASGIPATDSLLLEAQALFETRTNLFADTSNDVAHGAEVKAAFAALIIVKLHEEGFGTWSDLSWAG